MWEDWKNKTLALTSTMLKWRSQNLDSTCGLPQRAYIVGTTIVVMMFAIIVFDICQCIVDNCSFYGVTNMCNWVICLVKDSQWHHLECLVGNCTKCGVDMFITCPFEELEICKKIVCSGSVMN
jgi:hypothetical protein